MKRSLNSSASSKRLKTLQQNFKQTIKSAIVSGFAKCRITISKALEDEIYEFAFSMVCNPKTMEEIRGATHIFKLKKKLFEKHGSEILQHASYVDFANRATQLKINFVKMLQSGQLSAINAEICIIMKIFLCR